MSDIVRTVVDEPMVRTVTMWRVKFVNHICILVAADQPEYAIAKARTWAKGQKYPDTVIAVEEDTTYRAIVI